MRTVRFEEVDRIATYDILENDGVIEHYAGAVPDVPEGARIKGKAIARCLDMTRMPGGPAEPGSYTDDEGFAWQVERWTRWICKRPFEDFEGFVEWVKRRIVVLRKENCDARVLAQRTREHIERHRSYFAEGALDPDDLPVLVLESGVGLTDTYALCGLELHAMLLCTEPDLLEEWFEETHQCELRRVGAIADPALIPVALPYDDLASKNGPLFDPVWLRAHFMPRLKQLVDAWHARDTVCLFHSDGNLMPILDDLAGAGIDGLNPIETCAGMSIAEVRRRQPHLFMAGGIDVSQLLRYATPDEIRARCIEAIGEADGHGYFLGSTTEVFPSIPAENVVAMLETPKVLTAQEGEGGE